LAVSDWRERAERDRREKAQRRHRDARRRLRRMEEAALSRLALEGPTDRRQVVLDSERYAAPLLERLGARGRIQMLLWGAMIGIGVCAIVSFFSAPLMGVDLAVETVLVGAMLSLAYVI
jgi:hypothetical protein